MIERTGWRYPDLEGDVTLKQVQGLLEGWARLSGKAPAEKPMVLDEAGMRALAEGNL